MPQSVIASFDEAIASIERHPQFAFDIESTGLNPFRDHLLVLSLATEDGAWAIPFAGPVPHVPWQDPEMSKRIAHVFSDPNKLGISWNGGYDIRFLMVCGFEIKTKDADGMVASWLLDEMLAKTRSIGLKKQAKIILGVNMDDFESTNLLEGVVDAHSLQYAAADAKYTYIIWADHLFAKLQEAGLLKVFERISMPMIRVLVEMEMNGCHIDVDRLKKVEQDLVKQNDAVLAELRTMSGNPKFNPGSSKQLATLLFGPTSVLRVPVRRGHEWKVKSRQWSTDKRTLRRYKKDHPLFEKLTEYRKSKKLLTTYAVPLQEWVAASHDGRVRSHFRQTGTVTGRLCIAKGTLIDVARDISKHPDGITIEDVRPGDYAYCYDDDSQLSLRRVCWAGKTGHKHVIRVHWVRDDNQSTGFVDVTPEHRIRVADGSFVAAASLVSGTPVLGRSLAANDDHVDLSQHIPTNSRTITSVEDRGEVVDVYDIEVDKCHNFIAGGICCHNSSRGPNFQNISSKGGIRESFVPAPGMRLVVADYNQLELRMGGFLAHRVFGKSNIVDKYAQGLDLHEATRQTYDAMGIDRFNEAAVGAEEARRNAKVCVTGDTILATDRGLLRIDDIVDPTNAGELRPIKSPLRVASDTDTLPVESIYYGGVKQVFEVTTEHGLQLRCTPEHRCVVIDGGEITRVKLGELHVGDHLLMRTGTGLFGSDTDLPYQATGGKTSYLPWHPPTKLTGEICRVLGYLAAEGSWGRGNGGYSARISIRPDDAGIVDDLTSCWLSVFGDRGRVCTRDDLVLFTVSSKDVVCWLGDIGLESGSANIQVPPIVLQAPFELQREFLRGMFSGDGYVASTHRIVGMTLKSERCIRQIQLMLLNIGIVSWVSREERDNYGDFWALRMYGTEAERFIDTIGFTSAIKSGALADAGKRSTRYLSGVLNVLEGVRDSAHGLLRDKLTECVTGKVEFGNTRFELIQADVPKTLQWARDGNLWSTKIISIRDVGEEPVYDLVEPTKRLFVTNGLLTEDCNFGYFYGRSADAFAQDNPEVSYEEATTLREMFLTKLYPEIVAMHDHSVKEIVETGHVKLITGRRRRFPYCYGRDPKDVWWDGWVAWNSRVQGSSQDLIQIAMRDLFADMCVGRHGGPVEAGNKTLLFPASVWANIKMLIQVHDELVMEAPADVADDIAAWMSFRMGHAISSPIIEFPAEAGVGDNWVEAKNAPKHKKGKDDDSDVKEDASDAEEDVVA